jgi:peptide deformylase
MKIPKIITVEKDSHEKFLREKTKKFEFSEFNRSELKGLVQTMRLIMKKANGVGLSANQIGHTFRMFIAEYNDKFYAVFNPEIVKYSEEAEEFEEGCLSIPGKFGLVSRSLKVTLAGYNVEGKKIKLRARGFLAKIFQHEMDHLNGLLFIDRAKEIHKTPKSERFHAERKNNKHHDHNDDGENK